MRDREGLIARVTQMRRSRSGEQGPSADSPSQIDDDGLRALEARISALEDLVQGLQDSVHRESTRLNRKVGTLEAEIQPGALSRALSDHARERGL